jgi:hypothetical protein
MLHFSLKIMNAEKDICHCFNNPFLVYHIFRKKLEIYIYVYIYMEFSTIQTEYLTPKVRSSQTPKAICHLRAYFQPNNSNSNICRKLASIYY